MKHLFRKDIKDKKEFERIGYRYTQVLSDDEHHVYLYQMKHKDYDHCPSYELVVGKKYKNPDGNLVYVYPCDEDFGRYGWFIVGRPEIVEKKIAEKWLSLCNYPIKFRVRTDK